MHALVIQGFRSYFQQVHGTGVWANIAHSLGYAPHDFELNVTQDVSFAASFIDAGATLLRRGKTEILEDFGLFLASHDATASFRRLMRFSGPNFAEFVFGLPDLPPRTALAVPDLALPRIDVADTQFGMEIGVRNTVPGFDHVLAGIVRGMADDYGDLVQVEPTQSLALRYHADNTYWAVKIIKVGYSKGREFSLLETAQ